MSANLEQAANWNDASGRTWVELGDFLDRQLEAVGQRAMAALAPRRGESLVDVGCGCGTTTLDLAQRVGPGGRVVGVDISRPMLEVARRRANAAGFLDEGEPKTPATGLAHVRFVEADAQTHPLEATMFDGMFSRFGVMFFSDPVAAFQNLRRALRPGGRLAFVCWRSPAENPLLMRPINAARHRFPPQPAPVPNAPGPFAFADADRVVGLLAAAGFADAAYTPLDLELGGMTLEQSVTAALRMGPLAPLLRAHPELAPLVREDVEAALLPCVRDGIVWQPSATWIMTARNP